MKAPHMKSMFRNVQREPRKFKHTPRFYDEKKEDLKKRMRRVEMEVDIEKGNEPEEYIGRSISFAKARKGTGIKQLSASARKRANLRLFVILMVLIGIAYYFIKNIETFLG